MLTFFSLSISRNSQTSKSVGFGECFAQIPAGPWAKAHYYTHEIIKLKSWAAMHSDKGHNCEIITDRSVFDEMKKQSRWFVFINCSTSSDRNQACVCGWMESEASIWMWAEWILNTGTTYRHASVTPAKKTRKRTCDGVESMAPDRTHRLLFCISLSIAMSNSISIDTQQYLFFLFTITIKVDKMLLPLRLIIQNDFHWIRKRNVFIFARARPRQEGRLLKFWIKCAIVAVTARGQ